MTYKNHGAIVSLERILERLDRLDVKMIGRLVEDEQIRTREHEHGQCDASPLAPGERLGATLHFIARKTKPAKMALNEPSFPGRAQFGDRLVQGLVERNLREVLSVVGDVDATAES